MTLNVKWTQYKIKTKIKSKCKKVFLLNQSLLAVLDTSITFHTFYTTRMWLASSTNSTRADECFYFRQNWKITFLFSSTVLFPSTAGALRRTTGSRLHFVRNKSSFPAKLYLSLLLQARIRIRAYGWWDNKSLSQIIPRLQLMENNQLYNFQLYNLIPLFQSTKKSTSQN